MSAQAEPVRPVTPMTTARKKQAIETPQEVAVAMEHIRAKLLGRTVTEAAAELGISRQAVHKAIRAGHLRSVVVKSFEGRELQRFIAQVDLEAFKAKREKRPKLTPHQS